MQLYQISVTYGSASSVMTDEFVKNTTLADAKEMADDVCSMLQDGATARWMRVTMSNPMTGRVHFSRLYESWSEMHGEDRDGYKVVEE